MLRYYSGSVKLTGQNYFDHIVPAGRLAKNH